MSFHTKYDVWKIMAPMSYSIEVLTDAWVAHKISFIVYTNYSNCTHLSPGTHEADGGLEPCDC